jgi:hypothetical protein
MNGPTIYAGALTRRAHELQSEANELFKLHNMSADAPRAHEGETAYARRLINAAKSFSPDWNGVDINSQPDGLLPLAWKSVIEDAITEFKKSEGPLRQVVTTDDSGRRMRTFYGDPENCWAPFKATSQYVTAWNPEGLGRGAKSPTAIVPVRMLMTDGSIREAR